MVQYLVAAAVVTLLVALPLAFWVWPAAPEAVWLAAGVAFLVQVLAFALLTHLYSREQRVLLAWGGGALLRLVAVFGTAFGVAKSDTLPIAPVLLSLAGFLFLLLLLEPVFFRIGMRSR